MLSNLTPIATQITQPKRKNDGNVANPNPENEGSLTKLGPVMYLQGGRIGMGQSLAVEEAAKVESRTARMGLVAWLSRRRRRGDVVDTRGRGRGWEPGP